MLGWLGLAVDEQLDAAQHAIIIESKRHVMWQVRTAEHYAPIFKDHALGDAIGCYRTFELCNKVNSRG
jgi:hypothetical protein